jgi:hypothetical protein
VFHDIKYTAPKIFHKIHKGIKNLYFLDFVVRKKFLINFNMMAPKIIWKNLNFWNENYMVNFKPISNTLKMDFQKGL